MSLGAGPLRLGVPCGWLDATPVAASRRAAKLVLARDHMGQKPLFFYQDNEKIIFGNSNDAVQLKLSPAVLIGVKSFFVQQPYNRRCFGRTTVECNVHIMRDRPWQVFNCLEVDINKLRRL